MQSWYPKARHSFVPVYCIYASHARLYAIYASLRYVVLSRKVFTVSLSLQSRSSLFQLVLLFLCRSYCKVPNIGVSAVFDWH